jgi:hypothetical protein
MQLVKQTNDLYNSYLQYSADMLRSIFLDYSSLSFFYRPHPFENINSPRHFLSAQFPNVVILDNKQSFYTQSITCDLVISSMSTVSIELASSTPVPILELSPSSDFFSFVEPPLTHFLCDQVISSIRSFDLFMSNLPNHEIVHLNLFEQQVACKPSVWEGLFSALNFKYTKSSGYGSILFRLSLIPFAFLAIARSLIAQLLIVKISFLSALHYNPASKNPILYLFFGLSASSSQP